MIPFNVAHLTGQERYNLERAFERRQFSGGKSFCGECETWLSGWCADLPSLLVPSGTAALELSCILADIQPGDEVILPSYTFSSSANAIVLRGGVPVFVDVCADTLNIDPAQIEQALSARTKAIMPVHYAGVVCEMDEINAIAKKHSLLVIEDAAQALLSTYKGRPAGSLGDMAAFSFHDTKNIIAGEGGGFVTRHKDIYTRAEIVREKGTNRAAFMAGQVDKYTWVDVGSSFLVGEVVAAFLAAQFDHAQSITEKRLEIWQSYHEGLAALEGDELLTRPYIPSYCNGNGHIYYVILDDRFERAEVIAALKDEGIQTTFHYVPLHSAPAGQKYGRFIGDMANTLRAGKQLLRLPLFADLFPETVHRVIDALHRVLKS